MNPVSLSFCVVASCAVSTILTAARAEGSKDNSQGGPSPATFCRFVPERMDDFAWENDLVAFRAYGPAIAKNQGAENSGVDCWLKRVKYPIIDRWYLGKNYHMDTGEGNDPYHVGSSRGCGGTAIWKYGKMVTSGVFKEWKIISQSPDKSVFGLSYQYVMDDRVILEVKQITIELGKRLFKSESTFTENGKPAKLDIAIGLTTHDSKAPTTLNPERGWMSCWETIEGSGLGTGVVVDPLSLPEMFEISSGAKDQSHAVAVIHTDARGKTVHYAGYGWEKAGEIVSAEKWNRYLDSFWTQKKIWSGADSKGDHSIP